jgi:CheY-like chemotaxis protein
MPVMTGLKLYRCLVDMGHAIPKILVAASPNDVNQARALDDGAMCYCESQWMRSVSRAVFARLSNPPARLKGIRRLP